MSTAGNGDRLARSATAVLLALVPRGARVLAFGGVDVSVSTELASRLACTVTGVELSNQAAIDLTALLGQARFDVALFPGLLRELHDPDALLADVRPFLADGGSVVVSIADAPLGTPRPGRRGGGRLRPLTWDGVQAMFERSGYVVTHWLRSDDPIGRTTMNEHGSENLASVLARDRDIGSHEFIVRAVPNEPARHREPGELSDRDAVPSRSEIDQQRQTIRDQRRHLDALRSEIAVLTARQLELRELLLDAHEQLVERDDALRDARARVETAEGEVKFMKSMKAWRIASWYWRLLDRVRGTHGDEKD